MILSSVHAAVQSDGATSKQRDSKREEGKGKQGGGSITSQESQEESVPSAPVFIPGKLHTN